MKENAQRRHPIVSSYNTMIQRCYNKNNQQYKDYGGRGIKVCDRWLPKQPNSQGFWNFVEDMGERPEGTTLDRIENDKGYAPWNCYWATRAQQQRNRRNNIWLTLNGKTMVAGDWAKELGISKSVILYRYHKGLPVELILSTENYRGKSL